MIDSRAAKPPSAWEWGLAGLLVVNLAWTTLCLGGYRPETMVVTSALTGAFVLVHVVRCLVRPKRAVHPAGWWFLPFLIYAAGNVMWVTPVKWLGWREYFGWVQVVAVFWVVLDGVRSDVTRRVIVAALAAVATMSVVLACYQRFLQPDWLMLGRKQAEQFLGRASGSFGIPNSLAALLILLLPAAFELARRPSTGTAVRRIAWTLVGIFTLGLVLTVSRGAWIALAIVTVAWPLVAGTGSWLRRFAMALGAGLAVAFMVAILWSMVPIVRERLTFLVQDSGEVTRPVMWRASWKLFQAHPALGSGAASYNVLFEQHRPEKFLMEPQWTHNDYLNTLSDYGLVGFVLLFGAMAGIGWRCWRAHANRTDHEPLADRDVFDELMTSRFATALTAGLAAFALHLFVDFHFKIPALAMAFAVVAALVVQRHWPTDSALASHRTMRMRVATRAALAMGCIIAVGWGAVPMFRAEALRYGARQAIDRLALSKADAEGYRRVLSWIRADLVDAVGLDPGNSHAWADLSYAISLTTSAEPTRISDKAWLAELGRDAEAAANQALALTRSVGEHYIRRGVARDLQGRWLEAGNDFSTALGLSPLQPLAWYYHAYHHTLDRRGLGMAAASLAFCLRLDPNLPEGLALRQHLAISPKAP